MSLAARRSAGVAIVVLLGLAPTWVSADRDAIRKTHAAVLAAHGRQDWPTMLAESRKLVTLAPYSALALYNLACALSRSGEKAEAVKTLDRLAGYGVRFELAKDQDLAPLSGAPGFQAVVARMQALDTPIGSSTVAFTLKEPDLLVEAVVHDPQTQAFFVSSVHRRKIVRVPLTGAATDFVPEGTEGLLSAMALALDPERRALYVATEGRNLTKGLRAEDRGHAAVLEYDLETAQRRRRLVPSVEGGSAGDLAVGPEGTLYVADPQTGRIYRAARGAAGLEVLVQAGPIASAQGLALSKDGRELYVADYGRGIARVALDSGRVEFLEAPATLLLTGIDGLVLAGDSLVAIQNGLFPHRVLRLRLDPAGSRIWAGEILERKNPHFDEPTLGVRVENDFYYVANSQYEAFDAEGRPNAARLKEPVILKMRLPWLEAP